MTLLICCAALAAVWACGYLSACAGAERWLTLGEWWGITSRYHEDNEIPSEE